MAHIKKEKEFMEDVDDLMEKHNMVDYALVSRTVTGELECTWIAGTGTDPMSDRERANVLYAEMERLQLDMLARTLPKKVKNPPQE